MLSILCLLLPLPRFSCGLDTRGNRLWGVLVATPVWAFSSLRNGLAGNCGVVTLLTYVHGKYGLLFDAESVIEY